MTKNKKGPLTAGLFLWCLVMKILVVDDERAVRESLRRALELEGYEIELAADGGEALYRLEAPDEEPDAMILDVLMLALRRFSRENGPRGEVAPVSARSDPVPRGLRR